MTVPTKEQLEAEITATRSELGETVEALTHKLDVKARVRRRAQELPVGVPIGAAVAVILTVAVVLWRRRS